MTFYATYLVCVDCRIILLLLSLSNKFQELLGFGLGGCPLYLNGIFHKNGRGSYMPSMFNVYWIVLYINQQSQTLCCERLALFPANHFFLTKNYKLMLGDSVEL